MIARAAAVAGVIALTTGGLAADPPEPPRDLGLMEHASTRLAQLDVTVTGPTAAIHGLTAADFEVRLNDKLVPEILLDDLCAAHSGSRAAAASEAPSAAHARARAEAPRATTTYLLYFDMAHLTVPGRQDSIDSARAMLPRLLADGHRAMIVANAVQLKTVLPLTADVERLDAALTKMTDDVSTFDAYAATESIRLAEVIDTINCGMSSIPGGGGAATCGVQAALKLAHRYAAEERWRQERDLQRLSMALGRFADFDPPKAVLYFADTMRQNAGAH